MTDNSHHENNMHTYTHTHGEREREKKEARACVSALMLIWALNCFTKSLKNFVMELAFKMYVGFAFAFLSCRWPFVIHCYINLIIFICIYFEQGQWQLFYKYVNWHSSHRIHIWREIIWNTEYAQIRGFICLLRIYCILTHPLSKRRAKPIRTSKHRNDAHTHIHIEMFSLICNLINLNMV